MFKFIIILINRKNNLKKIINIFNLYNNLIIYSKFNKNFNFFHINIIGRIFKWTKYDSYMEFILPVSNKPILFLRNEYILCSEKNKQSYFILPTIYNNYQIVRSLLNVSNPSIFNKRGFRLNNRILYKKKGKITTYITNK